MGDNKEGESRWTEDELQGKAGGMRIPRRGESTK